MSTLENIQSKSKSKKPRQRRRGTNRATMNDVAKLAGVSASTVSLYLRSPDGVSSKKSHLIQSAIDTLNYVPNLLAGGLAATQTRVIAVIVPSLSNAFFSQTVSAMQRFLDSRGYQLLVGDSEYDDLKEQELVRTFLAWSPTGLVLTGATHTEVCNKLLSASDIQIVEMWELSKKPKFFQVGFSHFNVGRLAASHLFSLGRKHVAYIGANIQIDRRAQERGNGFVQTWEMMAKTKTTIIELDGFAKPISGVTGLRRMLEEDPDIDAVFCSNDIIAMGLIAEANKIGINIPEQLAVISFGDLTFAEVLSPTLTTIRPPSEQIAQHVIEKILNKPVRSRINNIQNNTSIDETKNYSKMNMQIDLAFELVIRNSS